jgi:hypothetical protein
MPITGRGDGASAALAAGCTAPLVTGSRYRDRDLFVIVPLVGRVRRVTAGAGQTPATGAAKPSSSAASAGSTRAVSRVPVSSWRSSMTSPSRCTRATRSPRS